VSKILLLNPPVHHYTGFQFKINPTLGLAIIASLLDTAGHSVKVIDLEAVGITPNKLHAYFKNNKDNWPDIVGFTALSVAARGCKESISAIRAAGYNKKVMVGGIYATLSPQELINEGADLVVTGECEGNIVEVVDNDIVGVVSGTAAPIADIPIPLWNKHVPTINTYQGNQPHIGWPETVTMFTRGCPHRCIFCVTGDTRIETLAGSKTIIEISKGDEVLTANGVAAIQDKQILKATNGLIEINVQGMFNNLRLTPDHKVLAIRYKALNRMASAANVKHRPAWIQEETPHFVQAGKLQKGDFLIAPYPTKTVPTHYSESDFELFGLYIAEGHISKQLHRKNYYMLVLTLSAREGALANHALKLLRKFLATDKGSIYHNQCNNTLQVTIGGRNKILWFRETFRTGAKHKTLPPWALLAPRAHQIALLRGMFWGDGHNSHSGIRYTTVSRVLAEQLRLILLRTGGVPNLFQTPANKRPNQIQGRTVNVSDTYVVTLFGPVADEMRHEFNWVIRNDSANRRFNRAYNVAGKGYALYPIQAINKTPYEGVVYDLTTNGTFVANGVAISNCANTIFGHQPIRFRPPENIEQELRFDKDQFGIQSLFVYDDELFGCKYSSGWFAEVMERITPLELTWKAQGRCSERYVTSDVLEKAYAAGCRAIMWGIESFSPKVLDAIKKDTKVSDIWATLKRAKAAGIKNWAFTMIGNYKETERDLAITAAALEKAKGMGLIDWRQTTIVTSWPGTELWDIQEREGWLTPPPDTGPQTQQVYADTPWLTKKQMLYWLGKFSTIC